MKALATIYDRISRYPVLFFGAVGASIRARYHIAPGGAGDLVLTSWVLFAQSAFSLSKKTADENAQGAAYVGAIEHQNVAQAAQILAGAEPPPEPPAASPAKPRRPIRKA